jgi:ketosteroid isomerase-like protein
MTKEESEITEIIDRETRAWDTKDVNLLISVFHEDMVWPWPRTRDSHDPMDWEMVLGRFDKERWCNGWQYLFDNCRLIRNNREIRKIVISNEKDGAFAVVDIDTLWVDKNNREDNWNGRVCKIYSKIGSEWKMTMQTGVLDYSHF